MSGGIGGDRQPAKAICCHIVGKKLLELYGAVVMQGGKATQYLQPGIVDQKSEQQRRLLPAEWLEQRIARIQVRQADIVNMDNHAGRQVGDDVQIDSNHV